MHRRDFLKTTGAAAVVASTAVPSADAADSAPEAVDAIGDTSPAVRLSLGLSQAPHLPGSGPERLARRIETATEGRFRIDVVPGRADTDLSYGSVGRHVSLHHAFAFFAGLPFAQGLDATTQHAWLSLGGGNALWEELAADWGLHPLAAGHSGPSPGVWASKRFETAADLAKATLRVDGLAAEILRQAGATAVEMPAHDLITALADAQIHGAEILGPSVLAAPDLRPLTQRLYQPGFHNAGMVLSLDVRLNVWEKMSTADRALFEACASQEYLLSIAEAQAHAALSRQIQASGKWPLRLAWPDAISEVFEEASIDVLENLAASDAGARRIHDSYQAFRHLLGEDLIV